MKYLKALFWIVVAFGLFFNFADTMVVLVTLFLMYLVIRFFL